jgi:hemoglobin
MNNEVSPISMFGDTEAERLQNVRRLVDRFYDDMDQNPMFARIRAMHPSNLESSREKLYLFLSGWLGGPDLYSPVHGHPRLRMRHMPFPIDSVDRDQWLFCMLGALRTFKLSEADIERLMLGFYKTADWMRNRPDTPQEQA